MRKADEMEMYINFKAMRLASLATNVVLLIWSFYDYFKFREIGLPLILIFIHGMVYFGSISFLGRKMAQDEE